MVKYNKAQLSLTNPHDAKACQKLLQFYVLTTLSLTILVYLHSFSCFRLIGIFFNTTKLFQCFVSGMCGRLK